MSGRSLTSVLDGNAIRLARVIEEDGLRTLDETPEELVLSHDAVHTILCNQLRLLKVCASWFSHFLAQVQRVLRKETTTSLLRLFQLWDHEPQQNITKEEETGMHLLKPSSQIGMGD